MTGEQKALTVAELIEALRSMPADAVVYAGNDCGDLSMCRVDRIEMDGQDAVLHYCAECSRDG